MSAFLGSYKYIDAKSIFRSNIRPDHIEEDAKSFMRALMPLNVVRVSNFDDGDSLRDSIVDEFREKEDIMDLLKLFGFEGDRSGTYFYRAAKSEQDKTRQENAREELDKLFKDLEKAKNNELDGLKDFLLNDEPDSDEDIPLPTSRDVNRSNEASFSLIQSFKTSIKPKYDAPVSLAFIRRRLGRLLYKQLYPETQHVDDDTVDMSIDREIRSLKEQDAQTDGRRTDELYLECLIRCHFKQEEALQMLRDKRPNLDPPPPLPAPKVNTNISMNHLVGPIQQQTRLLNNHRPANNAGRSSSRSADNWESMKHLIPIILKIRGQCPDPIADENTFFKIYRVLYSELLPVFGTMIAFNIEMFAAMLRDKPLDTIKHLDIAAMESFLTASDCISFTDIFFVDCPICAETYPQSQMESLFLCNHSCCLGCMKDFYRTAINNVRDASSINSLTCFIESHPITVETHHMFFIWLQKKVRLWFPDDKALLDKYEDKIMNATSGKLLKKCGGPKCISSFFAEDNPNPTRVRCPNCNFAQCSQCCRKWDDEHAKLTCAEYDIWWRENDPDDPDAQAWKLLQKTAISCPKCKAIYDYQPGGCEHFTCGSCKTDFCRMCLALFYFPTREPRCPRPGCSLMATMHAHCSPNCFREIRNVDLDVFLKLLQDNDIDVLKELREQYPKTSNKCPCEACGKPTIQAAENRLCEACYKQFLSSFVWKEEIQPWELYEDHQLAHMLTKNAIAVPPKASRQNLIQLCQQNFNKTLSKPQKLSRPTAQTTSS